MQHQNQQQNIKGSEKSNWKAFINPKKNYIDRNYENRSLTLPLKSINIKFAYNQMFIPIITL